MDVNLEYYKIFYYVGKLGRITLAASALSLTQPAVSQAIKQLENAVGVPLFIRTPKGVLLTKEGELLYHYIKDGYEKMKLGEKKLTEMMNLESGEMKIGASDMTLKYYLLPYLERFHEEYPGIKINVTNAPTPETIKYLAEGEIDFGIISEPIQRRDGFHYVPVREIEDIFVAGSEFARLHDRLLELKELEQFSMICLEHKTSTRQYMDDFLAANQVTLNPEFELATSDMIVQFVLRNLGIGSVVKDFAEPYLATGELIQLKFQQVIPKRKFYIVTNEKIPHSIAAGKLLKILT